MADDDRAVMDRLAALEAEVKADADAQRTRKQAALAKLRDQQVTQTAERGRVRARGAELVPQRASAGPSPSARGRERGVDQLEDLGGALELAAKANRVKQELQRKPSKGEKSWIVSGGASLLLGPLGWLYAGSWREAVPASAAWVLLAAIASKILPAVLLWPVLMVAMPLSAIAGVVYALQYNRSGGRQRLFNDEKKKPKQLEG